MGVGAVAVTTEMFSKGTSPYGWAPGPSVPPRPLVPGAGGGLGLLKFTPSLVLSIALLRGLSLPSQRLHSAPARVQFWGSLPGRLGQERGIRGTSSSALWGKSDGS